MNIYGMLTAIALSFLAGMWTQSRFHLANEVEAQNEGIVQTKADQKGAEVLAGKGYDQKDKINNIPPIEVNHHDKSDCAIPDSIIDQLRATAAEVANGTTSGSD